MSAIADNSAVSSATNMPLPAAHALRKLGRDLALARRKRGISTADMAGRLFISRDTLWRLERGDPTVSLGTLATAAFVLQLHDRLASRPRATRLPSAWTSAACRNAFAVPAHELGSSESDTAADLRFLLGAGSPLGGARPKAAVSLADGRLALAKFPKPDDTRDIASGEVLALTLAAKAGIRVVEHRLVPMGQHSVAVIMRFDRAGNVRIPFVSGASLLGLSQGDPGAYTLLADAIRQFGHDVPGDLRELWRRLVFSLLASNYDDHLRNHGFLMHEAGRWSLSPAYDLNPVPEIDRVRGNKTPIGEEHEEPSIAAALAVAGRFGLKAPAAKDILREVFTAVSAWRRTGGRLRLKGATLDAYASAFEQELMDEARSLLGK
jgi:serine/threonine-protein kinase HipA